MSLVFFVDDVLFSGFSIGMPVLRSTPFAQFTLTKGSAISNSPVARSSVYEKPLRSKFTSTFLICPFEGEIDEDVLIDAVVVPGVVRRLLIGPLRLSGIGIPREDRHRPFVVAGPLVGIPGSGVSGAVIEKVEFGIVAVPAPGRAAASLPLIPFPALLIVRSGESDFGLRSGAVHAPDLLAGLHIVCCDKSTNAKLSTADAGDHLVFHHHRSGR